MAKTESALRIERVVNAFKKLHVLEMEFALIDMVKLARVTRKQHDEKLAKELAYYRWKNIQAEVGERRKERAKPGPKYRSRREKGLTWTGRGSIPLWLTMEMRRTKFKKLDDYLIKKT